jgi:hypothetical protein
MAMKTILCKLAAFACITLSSASIAATTVPVQLISPTGSTAGQAIISAGPSSAPAWGGIGLNGIAAVAANTVLANATGSSSSPSAFSMPTCSASGNALGYTSGTGIVCVTGLAPLSGTNSWTGVNTFTVPPVLQGVTSGANGSAGTVGQCIPATSSAIGMTNGSVTNIISVSLTAGDWFVNGSAQFATGGVISLALLGINTTSATLPAIPLRAGSTATLNAGADSEIVAPMQRLNITTTTTVYLVGLENFTTSGTVTGQINACRWH